MICFKLIMLTVLSSFALLAQEQVEGGKCEYDKYNGKCRITKISKSLDQGSATKENPNNDMYFYFFPEILTKQNKKILADISKKEALYNTTGEFIKQFKLKVGSLKPCRALMIKKGTCTPLIFEFKSPQDN